MKKNLFLLLFILPLFVQAQLTDNFSDGDFINNPSWSGTSSQFIVNGSSQLQLNSAAAGTSYLYLSNNLSTLDNTEWIFWIHLNFAPSSGNFARVFLTSDQSNLGGSLNGYYLQFGEGGANDAVELFRKGGITSTSVCRGTAAQIAAAFTIGIKVTRDAAGLWSLLVDPTGGTSYALEASGTDATYNTSAYTGVLCTYTITNATSFYFDDFSFPFQPDLTPPSISTVNSIDANHLDVKFSESVDPTTAQTVANYSVNNGIGNPSTSVLDGSDLSLVHLTFSSAFADGVLNTITINSVADLSSNVIAANSVATFTYVIPILPQPFDIVINEFMADPDPAVALPAAEFVELYNKSNHTLTLTNWTFADASTTVTFGNQTLAPNSYLILCSSLNQSVFSSYGTVNGFSTFPSLNNTGGETLTLKDNFGNIIDRVYYDETYYHDNNKSAGGWSIERIDPNVTCENEINWRGSVNASGGTPGHVNSVKSTIVDQTAPQLVHACVVDSFHVQLFFSEPMRDTSIANASNYLISVGDILYGSPLVSVPSADLTSVTITLQQPVSTVIQTITLLASVSDCPGNSVGNHSSVNLAFPSTADSGDVIINEVLFSTLTGGAEFVELYNRSNKVIDLESLKITREDLTTHLLDPSVVVSTGCYLLFPREYMVLTKNPVAVKSQYFTENPNAFLKMSLPDLLTDEDILVLQNQSSQKLDQLHYYSSWHFPLLNDVHGVSLERLSPNRATQDETNWHSAAESVGFATPGYKNSQNDASTGNGDELNVDPEIFSPNEDGKNDVVNLHYHFSNPGNVANVIVYDSKGRLIRNLVNNELIGNDGSFVWDGITNDKDKARIGMYIFYVEVFDINGDTKTYKKTCVLASKL